MLSAMLEVSALLAANGPSCARSVRNVALVAIKRHPPQQANPAGGVARPGWCAKGNSRSTSSAVRECKKPPSSLGQESGSWRFRHAWVFR